MVPAGLSGAGDCVRERHIGDMVSHIPCSPGGVINVRFMCGVPHKIVLKEPQQFVANVIVREIVCFVWYDSEVQAQRWFVRIVDNDRFTPCEGSFGAVGFRDRTGDPDRIHVPPEGAHCGDDPSTAATVRKCSIVTTTELHRAAVRGDNERVCGEQCGIG